MILLLVPAAVALLTALAVVPPLVRAARARGWLDQPDGSRRIHHEPVPRLGGVALWIGALTGVTCWWALGAADVATAAAPRWLWGACVGLAITLVTGLIDDVRGVQARHKLVAQLAAAAIVVAAGFRIDVVSLGSGTAFSLGWAAVPISVLWIVAVTNAVNLIDGLDGLAAGITLVSVLALCVSALLAGHLAVLPILVAIFGGTLGFLRYNRCPARIFLGDVGSLSLGFALSLLSVASARLADGSIAVVVAIFALAFPFLDITIAMLRRWLRGAPLMAADGRHVHHQLVGLGLSHSRAVALICLFATGVAGLGLSITFAPPVLTLALVTLGVIVWVMLVIHGSRWLQYHEFLEAQASVSSGLLRARHVVRDRILARDLEAQILRSESWTELAVTLERNCAVFGFAGMHLYSAAEHGSVYIEDGPTSSLFRLDCPIRIDRLVDHRDFVLRLSWRPETRSAPLYAERVVRMIMPALQATLGTLDRAAVSPGERQYSEAMLDGHGERLSGRSGPTPPELRPRRIASAASAR